LGRINVAQGHFETAAEQLEQSLMLEIGPESQLNRGATSGYLAIALAHTGDRAGAIAALEEAEQIARRLENLTALAVVRVRGAVAYAALEMWDKAQELAAIGLSDCEAQDLPVYAFVARSVLGQVAHFKGDDATAYQLLQEAITWAEANQYTLFRHMPHIYLAEVALARGDTDTCREQAQISLELARRSGNRWAERRVSAYLDQLDS
jgi:tetratricopeptide (TPR) repeat protein